MMLAHSRARRRWLKGIAGTATALAFSPLRATPRAVTVLTAYPDEVIARFRAAFEARHPDFRIQIVWRMPKDALELLAQPDRGGIDVYWSASPRNFARLDAAGAWRPLHVDHRALPRQLGGIELAGPGDDYVATEVAGYGFALNRAALAELGVAPPRDWEDLTDPRLAGRIAVPNPATVGFAPVMIDIVLRAYGWARGWALWSEIAGGARLLDRGATFVSDEVVAGRSALGLSIDFFVASAVANGAPLEFVYPRHGGLNPAHVAITRAATNPEGARAFVDFLLSPEGQKILFHPDLRKLPIRPDVYAEAPAGYPRPFAAPPGTYDYPGDPGGGRLGLVAALFDLALGKPHERHAALWSRLRRAEKRGIDVTAIRAALCAAPAEESFAQETSLLAAFRDAAHPPKIDDLPALAGCARRVGERLSRAEDLLSAAGA